MFQEEEEKQGVNCVLCTNMEEQRQVALETLAQKSQQVQDMQKDMADLEEMLIQRCGIWIWVSIRNYLHINSSSFFCCSNNRCAELSKELANQKEEFYRQVACTREELESEAEVLQRRLEGLGREKDGTEMLHYLNSDGNACFLTVFLCVSALIQLVSEKDKQIAENFRKSETLRQGLIIEFSITISLHHV